MRLIHPRRSCVRIGCTPPLRAHPSPERVAQTTRPRQEATLFHIPHFVMLAAAAVALCLAAGWPMVVFF